jgi:predicted adenine nucleotide alpha hydrolase (AANH) superfamily ATPase/very-short-patch-repair endonuclease/nicotinic acid mononucleotide adenylyltransferase
MIYIFGAAFDPPHAGHNAIIRALLHYRNPEKIILIPSGKRNDKNYNTSDTHRKAMVDIFVNEIHTSEQDFSSFSTESGGLCRNDKKVVADYHFLDTFTDEMITRDVDIYARAKYGEDIVHIFGTDTIESMPEWDEEQYAAKKIQKLFVPRGLSQQELTKVMEWEWYRFSPWKGGVRGGYTEYNPSLREYATENRKNMNSLERDLWFLLRWEKLGYKFHRQKPIGEYIVDFYTPNIQLAVEIDGESHVENIEYDKKRTRYLNSLWIHVLRFTNQEIWTNLEWVRENLIEWIWKIKGYSSVTHPSPPFSGRGLEQIQNYELFTDSHFPSTSSTEVRQTIPEYTNIERLYEKNPKFIIPGLSKQISRYILEKRLYRNKKTDTAIDTQRNSIVTGFLPVQEWQKQDSNVSSVCVSVTPKPKVLVHVCCGPDVTMPILQLKDEYDIICFWYDPNIEPRAEYDKRFEAFKKVCEIENIPFIKGAYDVKNFHKRIAGLEHTPEKWEKCTKCYDMRLRVTARLAKRLGIKKFTTSLNTSPKKDLEKVFTLGDQYAEEFDLEFLNIPFRKGGGFNASVEYTRKHDIYRQNYCGCAYSIREGGGWG